MDRVSRHNVALALALVLAGLPFSSIVCIALCASRGGAQTHETHSGTHHGPRAANEQQAQTPGQPALASHAGHGCLGHAGIVRESTEALASGRADARLAALAPELSSSRRAMPALLPPPGHTGCSPPLPTPTRGPLVLRI